MPFLFPSLQAETIVLAGGSGVVYKYSVLMIDPGIMQVCMGCMVCHWMLARRCLLPLLAMSGVA